MNLTPFSAFVFDMRFPGQRYEAAMGMNYNYFRDYDPSTGRYMESDPIGLGGGISTYLYAVAAPASFSDPMGLQVFTCTRPLGGKPGQSAPPLLNHQYICIGPPASAQCNSMTASSGGAAQNIWPGPGSPGMPTSPADDYYHPQACEKKYDSDECLQSCLQTEWAQPRPYYLIGPGGSDCQQYSSSIMARCEKRCGFRQP